MRRLRTARAPEPDDFADEGFDRIDLEGDAVGPVRDEIAWLTPFGSEFEAEPLADGVQDESRPGHGIPGQARELVARGRRLDAVLLLRRHLADVPGDAEVRLLHAELLEAGGDAELAIDELTRLVDTSADQSLVLVRRGAILARLGKTIEAERDLRRAIAERAGYAPAYLHLGITLLRRGLGAEASGAFREVLRLSPDDPDALFYLGDSLQMTGDLDGALRALERSASLAPGESRSFKLMGRLLDRLGRTEEARVMHQRARHTGAG
jgi:Flp pilus assembly protein TadD